MVHWGADKNRAQSRATAIAGPPLRAQPSTDTTPAAPQLPAQPRTTPPTSTATTSRLFRPSYGAWSCTATRATTKRKQRKIESGSRKDKRGYLFRLPGCKSQHAHKQAEFSRQDLSWPRIKKEHLRIRTQGNKCSENYNTCQLKILTPE